MAELKKLQKNGTDIYPVTLEDVVFDSNGNTLPNKYQTKSDDTLNTTDKTVIGAINEVNTELAEVKQSVSNGKSLIASAITDKGIETLSDATFQTMADNIGLIEGNGSFSSSGSNFPSWYVGDEWIDAQGMPSSRYDSTSSVVGDKIYCICGLPNASATLNECYDISTNTWSTKTAMFTKIQGLTSSVVDNKIYCMGGIFINSGAYSNSNMTYDTESDSWEEKESMPNNETNLTSQSINNKIYCIGGYDYSSTTQILSTNECYDYLTDSWSNKTGMTTARYNLSSGIINDKIYCIGGHNGSNYLATNECYDPLTDTWSSKTDMKTARQSALSGSFKNNIYIIGGQGQYITNVNECYVVSESIKLESEDVSNGKSLIATAITNKGVVTSSNDTFQTMADNIGLIETKTNGGNINLPSWYEESLKDKWTSILASTQRGGLTASSVGDNIYAIGGHFNDYLNQNYKYNTQENTWTSMTTMPTAEAYLTSQSIDNKIYCMGGYNGNVKGLNQCYDTMTNTWSSKTAYNIGYHLTSSKIDNKIYVIGGYSISTIRNFNYYYDPSTDTWSTKTNMTTARYKCSASSVGSNIYVIGGTTSSQTYSQVVECYDSLTDTWSTKANVSYPTIGLSSEAIGKKVYVFGGLTTDAIYSASTYCYDISTDIWTKVYTMNSRRAYFGTAVVNNNIYVICGETTDGNKLNLSEFYIPN